MSARTKIFGFGPPNIRGNKRSRPCDPPAGHNGVASNPFTSGRENKRIRRSKIEDKGSSVQSTPLHNILKPLGVDSFIFHKKLGEGSFGKVFLASDRTTGHQVAIKMVKKRPLLKYAAVKRAMDEKRVLELAGGSPFLTASYATFQTVDYLCYVMEYLRGGDLFDFLNTRAPLDEDTIRFLTAEIICGLQYLHTMGVIHRDISPENIFLDSTGHIKIGDYGLCATDVSAENKASGCVGAQNYMAPEVFNQDSYDSSVDWFSLGVLMYKMTTGTMMSVNQDRRTYPEGCSEYLVDIIKKLLRTNAEKRLEFATTIRNHPFFADIDWAKLMAKEVAPPFSMASAPLMDPVFYVPVQHIISQREAKKPAIPPEGQKMFWGFSSSSHTWKMLQRQAGSQVLSPRDMRILLVTQMSSSFSSSSSSSYDKSSPTLDAENS